MALPPTIPTSFVPKQPVTAPRKRTSGANPFLVLSYIIAIVAILGAAGVFGYQFYLDGVAKKKASDVAAAQAQIDQATVTSFIHLRDRFTAAKSILSNHIALSQFFNDLEALTLQGVQFHTLNIIVSSDRTAKISMTGSARSFNTVAAQSAVFANDKRIKRAIFSNINGKDGVIAFNLSAEIDTSLVAGQMGAAPVPKTSQPAIPTATSSPVQSAKTATSSTARTPSP